MDAPINDNNSDPVIDLQTNPADEIKTTFASSYAQEISLDQALELDVLKTYALQATGQKFLVNPSL